MIATTIFQVAPPWARHALAALAGGVLVVSPALAQNIETFDPDESYSTSQEATETPRAIDGDLTEPDGAGAPTDAPNVAPADAPPTERPAEGDSSGSGLFDKGASNYSDETGQTPADGGETAAAPADGAAVATKGTDSQTYGEDDLIGAAEGVFGKGAEGIARMIEDLLKDQGEPNGYIVGREAGGAFIIGARYGSGTLFHKVEGERKVYWTGPSIGLDAGANAANTFVLVYNLFDTEDLFKRYPAGEGQAYLVGGLHASYMRKGDVVLIPIRMGAGVRLGVNAGYMKFSKKQRWLPF